MRRGLRCAGRSLGSPTLDLLRGASVVYLTVTFIVVVLLLSGADLQVAVPWVDFVLHKLFPVVVVPDVDSIFLSCDGSPCSTEVMSFSRRGPDRAKTAFNPGGTR